MKYLKLFENYTFGENVEKEFTDISRYKSNELGGRELKIIQGKFKDYEDEKRLFHFIKDDGYYYMRYKSVDLYTKKDFYFKYNDFNEMLKMIDNITKWRSKLTGSIGYVGGYTSKDVKQFMNDMNLKDDPYFTFLLKSNPQVRDTLNKFILIAGSHKSDIDDLLKLEPMVNFIEELLPDGDRDLLRVKLIWSKIKQAEKDRLK